jgi:dTDP-4-amino-4,6-dideoxygalactose transaminase
LDEVQAAILRVQLKALDKNNEARRTVASIYNSLLKKVSHVSQPIQYAQRPSIYHLYVIQTANRDRLAKHLLSAGIQTQIHYPIPLHLQPAFSHLRYKRGDLPKAEKIADHILSLPMYPHLSKENIRYIVNSIAGFIS